MDFERTIELWMKSELISMGVPAEDPDPGDFSAISARVDILARLHQIPRSRLIDFCLEAVGRKDVDEFRVLLNEIKKVDESKQWNVVRQWIDLPLYQALERKLLSLGSVKHAQTA